MAPHRVASVVCVVFTSLPRTRRSDSSVGSTVAPPLPASYKAGGCCRSRTSSRRVAPSPSPYFSLKIGKDTPHSRDAAAAAMLLAGSLLCGGVPGSTPMSRRLQQRSPRFPAVGNDHLCAHASSPTLPESSFFLFRLPLCTKKQ